jgi:hypothetical protein
LGPGSGLETSRPTTSDRECRICRRRRSRVTHVLRDINVTPDFTGLPPSVYHGLVHLTNNAAAVLTLVAALGLVVSLIGLVIASFTANRELGDRAKGGIAVSVFSVALLYLGVAAANYAGHLFS